MCRFGHKVMIIKNLLFLCAHVMHGTHKDAILCVINIAQFIRPWMSRMLGSDKIVPVRRGRHVDK